MANFTDNPKLGKKYTQAFNRAFEMHQKQIRKQGEVPYISHLMAVSSLVLEAGGSEVEAIAALLHDIVEDVSVPLFVLECEFGGEVMAIVEALTERENCPEAGRKAAYVEAIKASPSAILISAADKLHNLRGYATTGQRLWKPSIAEFYTQLIPIYVGCDRVPKFWNTDILYLSELCNLSATWT